MRPKFSKALLAAGLAAALVGCGGGSSTTTMDDSGSMTEPTETTALDGTYATANDLVGKLSADSTPAQFKEAKDARTALLNQLLAAGDDVSSEKRTELNGKLTTLENAIMAAEKARDEKLAAAKKVEDDKKKADEAKRLAGLLPNAWYKSVKNHTPADPGPKNWPSDDVLTGTETEVDELPTGWEGTEYKYSRVAMDEQGKTFKKTVTRMTPEVKTTWAALSNYQKANPADYLGENVGMGSAGVQAITDTIGSESQVVVSLGSETNLDTIPKNTIVKTKIHKDHLAAPTTDELPTGYTADAVRFFDPDRDTYSIQHTAAINSAVTPDAPGNSLTDLGGASGLLVADLFGRTGAFKCITPEGVTDTASCSVSFDEDGFLQFSYSLDAPAGTEISISFLPFDRTAADLNSHPITYRKGGTKSATTEFAYWASTKKDGDRGVTIKTFARGMGFDDVIDTPQVLTGSARYTGLAGGYYAKGTESNGEFTADTMLTANFGTNMVNGTINGFEAVTGGGDLSEWSLTLNSTEFIGNNDTFIDFTGNTVSEGGPLGTWKGQFLGRANPGNDLVPDMTDDYPEAVVGNFTGHFADGHVAGAFGADLEE